jgi:hypothetical protein
MYCTHDLDEFLLPSSAPPRFLNATDRATATLNPAYRKWQQRDQMLLSWLQSTLFSDILARFLGAQRHMNFGEESSRILKSNFVLKHDNFALSYAPPR